MASELIGPALHVTDTPHLLFSSMVILRSKASNLLSTRHVLGPFLLALGERRVEQGLRALLRVSDVRSNLSTARSGSSPRASSCSMSSPDTLAWSCASRRNFFGACSPSSSMPSVMARRPAR